MECPLCPLFKEEDDRDSIADEAKRPDEHHEAAKDQGQNHLLNVCMFIIYQINMINLGSSLFLPAPSILLHVMIVCNVRKKGLQRSILKVLHLLHNPIKKFQSFKLHPKPTDLSAQSNQPNCCFLCKKGRTEELT